MDSLEWLAGLLEGEGYFGRTYAREGGRRRPTIILGMTDRDVVDRAASLIGSAVWETPIPKKGNKVPFRTERAGIHATELMIALLPLMGKRRQQQIRDAIGDDGHITRKVGPNEAEQIREEYKPGKVRQQDLAEKYGISQVMVSKIVRGEYHHRMKIPLRGENPDIEWLAGFLEGEGYFKASPSMLRLGKLPRIRVSGIDIDTIEHAASIMGTDRITERPPQEENHNIQYLCSASSKYAIPVMKKILPFMGERRSKEIRRELERWQSREEEGTLRSWPYSRH